MIKRIDHVAVAVRNTEEALQLYRDVLGLTVKRSEDVPDQGVKATLIEIGDTEIELLEAIDPQGGVARFLERSGEGIHHICLEVDDVDSELKALEQKGIQLVDKQGRPGAFAVKIGFLHPRSLKGILVELAQKT